MGMVLCLACLMEAPGRFVSPDLVQDVEYLRKENFTSCEGCMLYTPTWRDYQCCPVTTLECFSAEVNVLLREWRLVRKPGLARGLKNFADKYRQSPQREPDFCQCERHEERNAEEFLLQLSETLKGISSATPMKTRQC
ncbi:interleukin 15, like [Nerophis lumbriciformis]|uniref:interleukin 15, like n=1 Tax=Nerophis lumbriciformis TaxID=546530 RepID=UPI002AE067C7|nr:interleukin 15, like [Nerophis lumbriciformis]